jgi:signal transduction histidine kinase
LAILHINKCFNKALLCSSALAIIFFFGSSSLQAQQLPAMADSLENELRMLPPSQRFGVLEKLIFIYLHNEPKKALWKSQEALSLAQELKAPAMQALALNNIGNSLRYLLSDYDSALSYCFRALAISQQHKLQNEQIIIFNTIGEIYQEVGNAYKAIEYFMQAQMLAERNNLHAASADAMLKVGQVYGSIGNEGKATDYYKKALYLSENQGYTKGVADSHYWLANSLLNKSNLELAYQTHQTALAIRTRINDPTGIGLSQLALGRIYMLKGQPEQALQHMQKALELFKKLKDEALQATVYINLASLQLAQKKYKAAVPYLQTALNIGEFRNDKKIIRDSYEQLYTSYAALKNYEQALKYKDLFVAISDFIYGEESERRMAELQTRFEIAEKEREIEVLKKDNQLHELARQKQANFRDFLITGLILLAIILLLIIYLYRNNRQNTRQLQTTNHTINQQNIELQELNATKDKFFSIISHDLKGPLNSLTAFSGMLIKHTDALTKEEIQMLARDFDKSLKNLLSLLENLLEWSRSQTGILEIKQEPLELKSLINLNVELLRKMAENKEIHIQTEVPGTLWAFAGKNQMNTVLRNLISNAVKFTKPGGQVIIRAQEWKDVLEIIVTDNGIGIRQEVLEKLFKIEHKHSSLGTANEKGTGLGLMLCKEFIEQSGGTLKVESQEGKGSTFRFTVPKTRVLQEAHSNT